MGFFEGVTNLLSFHFWHLFFKEELCYTGRKDLEAAVPNSLSQDSALTFEYMTVIHKFKEEQICFNSIFVEKDSCYSCIKGKIQELNEIIKRAGNNGLQKNLTKIALCV